MFEKASRVKLRFDSRKGGLSVEDLWDLDLSTLDDLAKKISKELRSEEEESFIPSSTRSKPSTNNSLRLDLLKHVINVKVQEKESRRNKAAVMAQVEKLTELAEAKANEQLASQSLEDIQKQIEELKATL